MVGSYQIPLGSGIPFFRGVTDCPSFSWAGFSLSWCKGTGLGLLEGGLSFVCSESKVVLSYIVTDALTLLFVHFYLPGRREEARR